MMTPSTNLHHETNDSLRCDEVWDMSPVSSVESSNVDHAPQINDRVDSLTHSVMKEDCVDMFHTYFLKELKYTTGLRYSEFLEANAFVDFRRLDAINWFIHSQPRLNFGFATLFNAVNYLDRFIDFNECQGWSHWMMDLLSLSCLSVAIKFGETGPSPSLHAIQEGLEYCFEESLIKKMEFKLMRSLEWELNSVTPHSYVELFAWELKSVISPFDLDKICLRLNDVLLATALDNDFLEYRPSVRAMSGLICILEDLYPSSYRDYFPHIVWFLPPNQEENQRSCSTLMAPIVRRRAFNLKNLNVNRKPTSPDTVLTVQPVAIYEEEVDLSFVDGTPKSIKLKRKREYVKYVVNKRKKCVH